MDYKNLIPAPIDSKNIVEDWIEEIFDGQCAVTNGKDKYLGFINEVAMECTINNNALIWSCIDGITSPHREFKEKALNELRERLERCFDDNDRIIVDYRRYAQGYGFYTLVSAFYWANED